MPKPILSADFKVHAKDFIVKEQFALNATHTGEHLWLYIKKTNLNTAHLAKLLSLWANIPVFAVGYSGLKDRYATTFQWFSLHCPTNKPSLDDFDDFMCQHLKPDESVQICQHAYHQKKLGRGSHRQNHFEITLQNVILNPHVSLSCAIHNLRQTGMPNFFGVQRFGHDNLAQFSQFTKRYHKKHKLTQSQSLLISAAKSHIFNAILAKRVANGTWNYPIGGDVFMLNQSQSVFVCPIDELLIQRMQAGDIHPTGLLFGAQNRKMPTPTQDCQRLENSVIADHQALAKLLSKINSPSDRRALRVMIGNLSYQQQDNKTLTLCFELPKGAFATTLLDRLCHNLNDCSPKPKHRSTCNTINPDTNH